MSISDWFINFFNCILLPPFHAQTTMNTYHYHGTTISSPWTHSVWSYDCCVGDLCLLQDHVELFHMGFPWWEICEYLSPLSWLWMLHMKNIEITDLERPWSFVKIECVGRGCIAKVMHGWGTWCNFTCYFFGQVTLNHTCIGGYAIMLQS